MANRDAGAQLWSRTDLKPSDVQMPQAYDGFSFITMSWIEALGFCAVGESGPFIEGGERIARDGVLPLNTHGGQLSAGRLHGYGFLHEGRVQMWGEAGDRQIATPPEVGVVARRRRQHLRLPPPRPRLTVSATYGDRHGRRLSQKPAVVSRWRWWRARRGGRRWCRARPRA